MADIKQAAKIGKSPNNRTHLNAFCLGENMTHALNICLELIVWGPSMAAMFVITAGWWAPLKQGQER